MSELDEELTRLSIKFALVHNEHPWHVLKQVVRLINIGRQESIILLDQCKSKLRSKENELPFSMDFLKVDDSDINDWRDLDLRRLPEMPEITLEPIIEEPYYKRFDKKFSKFRNCKKL